MTYENIFVLSGVALITFLTIRLTLYLWRHPRMRRMWSVRIYIAFIALIVWMILFAVLVSIYSAVAHVWF